MHNEFCLESKSTM
ncbi:hypothetical protein CFP56_005170 [Quercus suber]|uniref:Uncharacterized protein n=1 Tax=Quercus suber TaxID=58331 RepID=A0AAW0IGY6_QUESU